MHAAHWPAPAPGGWSRGAPRGGLAEGSAGAGSVWGCGCGCGGKERKEGKGRRDVQDCATQLRWAAAANPGFGPSANSLAPRFNRYII